MTKELNKVQEYNRRKIICAVHNTEDYDEALKKEIGVGCVVIDILHYFFGKYDPQKMILIEDTGDESFYFTHYRANPTVEFDLNSILDKKRFTIIGKPLTLNRVLLALNQYRATCSANNTILIDCDGILIWWDLTKETLEMQEPEVQLAIAKLLGYQD